MLIAIPSKGRAGNLPSALVLPSATMFVPEGEVDAYKKHHRNPVVGVPSSVRGITPTRNFILDSTKQPFVVMIDDDVQYCGYRTLTEERIDIHQITDENVWHGEFAKLFEVAISAGARIWGLATVSAAWSYRPWRPFIFRTYITASCMGILNDSGIRFDERFVVKEDYELCLRCLKEDGLVIGARFLHWQNRHWTTEGGCKTYRTSEVEANATKLLESMYPGLVERAPGRGGSEFSIELRV